MTKCESNSFFIAALGEVCFYGSEGKSPSPPPPPLPFIAFCILGYADGLTRLRFHFQPPKTPNASPPGLSRAMAQNATGTVRLAHVAYGLIDHASRLTLVP